MIISFIFFCWGVGLKKKKRFLDYYLVVVNQDNQEEQETETETEQKCIEKKKKKEKKRRKEWEGELIGSVRVEMRGEARRLIVD